MISTKAVLYMKTTAKRMFAWILSVCMILAMLPTDVLASEFVEDEEVLEIFSEPEDLAVVEEEPAQEPEEEAEAEPVTVPWETMEEVPVEPSVDETGVSEEIEQESEEITVDVEPFAAGAVPTSGTCGADAYWEFTEDGTLTIWGNGMTESYSETNMPWKSFRNRITTVIIQEGITGLGDNSLYDCTELNDLYLPDSLEVVGYGCSAIVVNIHVNNIAVFINLRSTYEWSSISFGAFVHLFVNGAEIENVVIPAGTVVLRDGLFTNVYSIKTVHLPDSVRFVGEAAFAGCSSLEDINIPDGVETLGYKCFEGTNLTSISLPQSIISLGEYCFAICRSFSDVYLSEGLDYIGLSVFEGCSNLNTIIIPASVSEIGRACFANSGLQRITFMGDAPKIDSFAFRNTSVEAFYNPAMNGWDELIQDSFNGSVTWIPLDTSLASGSCGVLSNWTFYNNGKLAITGSGAVDSYTFESQPWAAYRDTISEISIADGITELGAYAFSGCNQVTSVTISATVSRLEVGCFADCLSLNRIAFQGDAPAIAEDPVGAFAGVTAEAAYYYSNNGWEGTANKDYGGQISWTPMTKLIDGGQFNISIFGSGSEDSKGDWSFKEDGTLTVVGSGTFTTFVDEWSPYLRDVKQLVIKGSFSKCNRNMSSFGNWDSLEKVYLDDLTLWINGLGQALGEWFFWNQSVPTLYVGGEILTELVIPEGITEIPDQTFVNCKSLEKLIIPEGVQRIGSSAFLFCENLKEITLPASLQSIDEGAFRGCESISKVYIPSLEAWMNVHLDYDSSPMAAGTNTTIYINGTPAETISVPVTSGSVLDSTFSGWNSLKTVMLPANTIALGNDAFSGCNHLTSINIPEGMQSICEYAFAGCTSLSELTIPASVNFLGYGCFYNCQNLRKITFLGAAPVQDMDISGWGQTGLFQDVTAEIIYNPAKANWNLVAGKNYGGSLTWIPADGAVTLISQPQSIRKDAGSMAVFSVSAVGNGLRYQWQQRAADGEDWEDCGTDTIGSRSANLIVVASAARSGMAFRCVVSSGTGETVVSDAAQLDVHAPLAILVQPKDQTVLRNEIALFVTAASGVEVRYQWQFRTSADGLWMNCSGVTAGSQSDTLRPIATEARDGYQYRCVLTDGYGSQVVTDGATLTILHVETAITCQPEDRMAEPGETVTFTIAAEGADLRYRWQYCAPGKDWANCSAATVGYNTPTIQPVATTSRNGYKYRCFVSGSDGELIASEPADLIVALPCAITSQPEDQTVEAGMTATFAVTAEGSGLNYQWQYKTATGAWANCSSATIGYHSATLQPVATKARNGYQYRCVITGNGITLISEPATLTVLDSFAITAQPMSQTMEAGQTAAFSVAASGSGLSYQWQYCTPGGNWANCSSATVGYRSETVSPVATTGRNGYQYRCVVKNADGNSLISDPATLTVAAAFAIVTQPTSETLEVGQTASFTVKATGSGLRYQWEYKTPNGSWVACSKATAGYRSETLNPVATTGRNGYQYRCVVTDQNGATLTTEPVILSVAAAFGITSQPKSQTVAVGESASFTVSATGSGLSYQWEYKTPTGSWAACSKATIGYRSETLQPVGTTGRNGYQYRCVIKDANGDILTTEAATLTVM